MLREQTGRLVRFSADAADLACRRGSRRHQAGMGGTGDLVDTMSAAVADRYADKNVRLSTRAAGAGPLNGPTANGCHRS